MSSHGNDSAGASDRPTVLIVDDDEQIRRLVMRLLAHEGMRPLEAAEGTTALAVMKREHPDLILLDVLMPGMSGYDMLQRVQDQHGVGTIPVIMFSGQPDESAERAAEHGAQAFLGKPVDPQALIASTKQLIRASRA